MNDAELIDRCENPLPHISIADACAKYGIRQSTLLGRIARNDFDDPVTVSGDTLENILLVDNWQLQALKNKE